MGWNNLLFGSTFTLAILRSEGPLCSGALGTVSFELHAVPRPLRSGALGTVSFVLLTVLHRGTLGIELLLVLAAELNELALTTRDDGW
jgi:hypothetical protein